MEPLARTFFRHMRLDEDADEDDDEDTPLKTRPDEVADDGGTRNADVERLSVRPPLSSLLSRFTSEEIGPSAVRRRRDTSSPLRSTGPRRASLCPPDATTPLHLSQSTCRGRSLMEFMMDVASSQR